MLRLSSSSWIPDLETNARLINGCWLFACYGVSIVQMWLLSRSWTMFHSAGLVASLYALWLTGTLLASSRRFHLACLIGASVSFVLLQEGGDRCVGRSLVCSLLPAPLLPGVLYGLLAFFAGMCFECWLGKACPGWPQISEQSRHFRQWTCLTIGLAVVWWQESAPWSLPLACCLFLPYLLLTLCQRSPLPVASLPMLMHRTLGDRHPTNWELSIDTRGLPAGWVWSFLRRRHQEKLTVLALSVNIVLAVVWGSIITPFAAHLFPSTRLLVWLALSQVMVLLGCQQIAHFGLRSLIGKPYRALPPPRRAGSLKLLLPLLVCLSSSLILFGWGIPFGWPLVGVFALYTFAGALWSSLLPRLLPTGDMLAREAPLMPSLWRVPWDLPEQQSTLALERAVERVVARRLARIESCVVVVGLPLCGWLIDQQGSHLLFLLGGMILLLCGTLFVLAEWREKKALRKTALGEQGTQPLRPVVRTRPDRSASLRHIAPQVALAASPPMSLLPHEGGEHITTAKMPALRVPHPPAAETSQEALQ